MSQVDMGTVLHAATAAYLAGQPIDMSALAADLGLSRATLYRRVGNHDQLLGLVLANLAEHTFGQIKAELTESGVTGTDKVLAGFERYIDAVVEAPPLHRLIEHDPVLFMRVVMSPGVVEDRLTGLLTDMLNEEVAAGRATLKLPTEVLAKAMVRIGDSFMYSHLLGGEPETDNAVMVATLMLTSAAG